jgi:hypothetical protein
VSEIVKLAALPKDAPQRNCQNVPVHSCKSCRLGLWYYGAGQVLRDRKSFAELEQAHCDLHEIGLLLVKKVAEAADLEQLTPHLRELSRYSMSVLRKLQMLEDERLIDMHSSHGEWIAHMLHPSKLNG